MLSRNIEHFVRGLREERLVDEPVKVPSTPLSAPSPFALAEQDAEGREEEFGIDSYTRHTTERHLSMPIAPGGIPGLAPKTCRVCDAPAESREANATIYRCGRIERASDIMVADYPDAFNGLKTFEACEMGDLEPYALYSTRGFYFVIAHDKATGAERVLKRDRTPCPWPHGTSARCENCGAPLRLVSVDNEVVWSTLQVNF